MFTILKYSIGLIDMNSEVLIQNNLAEIIQKIKNGTKLSFVNWGYDFRIHGGGSSFYKFELVDSKNKISYWHRLPINEDDSVNNMTDEQRDEVYKEYQQIVIEHFFSEVKNEVLNIINK